MTILLSRAIPPWKILLILTLSIAVLFGWSVSLIAQQSKEDVTLTGSWKSDLFLRPNESEEDFLKYNSTLDLNYSLTSFTVGSLARFKNTNGSTGLSEMSFEIDGRLGTFDISSDVVFDPEDKRLDYWLSETSLTFAGATIQTIFLMEYVVIPGYTPPFPARYGAGAEISLSKTNDGGINVDIQNRFGLKKSETEVLGLTPGSGYDIDVRQFGPDGKFLPKSEVFKSLNDFHYVNTVAEIGGLSLGCCTLDTETKFSRENGFEYSLIEFLIEPQKSPLTFDIDLKFTPQTKSIILDPEIDVSFDCFTVYLDMIKDGSSEYTFNPEVEGFELKQLPVGPVRVSSITSLKGNLYKTYGSSNLKLRSYNYIIDPDKPLHYQQTGFDEVISLETESLQQGKYPSFDLGIDFYFDMSGSENIFDLSLVTINSKNSLSKDLDLGTGVTFDPAEGPTEILIEFDVYF